MSRRFDPWETRYVPDDDQLWEKVDTLARRAIEADDPWDAYDLAGDIGPLVLESEDVPEAYQFWAELADLYDDPRLGIIPPEGAQAALRMAATTWLETPLSDRSEFVSSWRRKDPVALVESLGYVVEPPPNPRVEQPWRGRWETIAWVVDQIERTHSPYAAAQCILHEVQEPILWEAGRGDELAELLRAWDDTPSQRDELNEQIKEHLRSLSASDVPPIE